MTQEKISKDARKAMIKRQLQAKYKAIEAQYTLEVAESTAQCESARGDCYKREQAVIEQTHRKFNEEWKRIGATFEVVLAPAMKRKQEARKKARQEYDAAMAKGE